MSSFPNHDSAATSVREGSLVAGKYRIGKILGQGGMGVVLAAAHETLGTPMALKVLRPEAVLTPGLVGRFLQEARAAALLQSEHVAKVHDFGTLDDGSPYLVMEYLHGRDLSHVLDKRAKLSLAESVEILRQTCDAVAEAHATGIVHRDLKPHNLFLVSRPNHAIFVKVLDFGIAKMLGSERFGVNVMTQSSAMLGTPLYMSPEQLRAAKTADGRSDIWSLGIIFHQMLTGSVPFDADSLAELSVKVLTTDAPSIDHERLGLPEEIAHIVARCLQRDPAHRFTTVEELAMALEPFVSNRRVSIPDFSSPVLDVIATGPRRALLTGDAAFPTSSALRGSPTPAVVGAWPTSTTDPVSVDAGAGGLASADTLIAGTVPAVAVSLPPRRRLSPIIALIAASLAVGGVLVFVLLPKPVTPPAPVAGEATAAVTPSASASPSPTPLPSAIPVVVGWDAVPSAGLPAGDAPSTHRRDHAGHGDAPSASGHSAPAASAAVAPAVPGAPKVGPNGAPILAN